MKRFILCALAGVSLSACYGAGDPSDRYFWLAQQNIANQQFIASQSMLQSQIESNERRVSSSPVEQWQPFPRTR